MDKINKAVRVGVGVMIFNEGGRILLGKRNQTHGKGEFAIPGGKPDLGETFEKTAIREVKEETNLDIENPKVFAVVNNLSIEKYGDQWVVILLKTDSYSGDLKVMEPEKHKNWNWYDLDGLPQPLFEMSEMAIECYKNKFFVLEK